MNKDNMKIRGEESKDRSAKLEKKLKKLDSIRKAILNILEDTYAARDALKESETRYRDLYQHAPIMYHTIDLDGNILECNEEILTKLGYTCDEYIGHNIQEFITPKYRNVFFDAIKQIVEKGGIEGLEREYIRKDGTILPAHLSASLVNDESGNPIAIRSALVDITDRIERERLEKQRLIESQLRSETLRTTILHDNEEIKIEDALIDLSRSYKEILSAECVVIFHSSSDKSKYFNCAIAADGKIVSKIKEHIPSHSGTTNFLLEKNKKMLEIMNSQNAIVTDGFTILGQSNNIEAHNDFFPDMKVLFISLKPFGRPWGLVGIVVPSYHIALDLSTSIKINLESGIFRLEELNTRVKNRLEIERLANFPQENPLPVVETDNEGNLTYLNPACKSLLKQLGQNNSDVEQILPENYKELIKDSFITLKNIPPQEVDIGDSILLWTGHPLKQFKLFHFYATDISDLKKTEQKLMDAKNRAETSDRLKNVFLSTISHEVRTPLNVILGYTDLLYSELKDSLFEEQLSFFDAIQESGNRLKHLIDDVLDVSQIEADKVVLNLHTINGDKLVENSIKEIIVQAENKGLKIIKKFGAPDINITVDKIRLQQALGNILQNAVKFTHKGSITINTIAVDNNYHIIIKDTGIGIKGKFIPYLFTLFRQAEEGYDRSYEGAGLGLAISQRLINSMNGKIEVESKEGKGSKFTVIFPASVETKVIEEEIIIESETLKSVLDNKKQVKVLILEDNPANLRYLQFLLKKLNMDQIATDTGEKACDLLEKQSVDCMLIDISLAEGMSGIEFLSKIKKMGKFEEVPKIAVTAHAMKGKKEEFINEGFDDYLGKPFTIKDLQKVLSRNL